MYKLHYDKVILLQCTILDISHFIVILYRYHKATIYTDIINLDISQFMLSVYTETSYFYISALAFLNKVCIRSLCITSTATTTITTTTTIATITTTTANTSTSTTTSNNNYNK